MAGQFFFDHYSACRADGRGANSLFNDSSFLGQQQGLRSTSTEETRSGTTPVTGTNKRSRTGAPPPLSFFTTSEELLLDDEYYYYDEQLPEKKRRLTPDQVHMLEKSFETENKLEPERKTELANKLGLQPRQVAVWFQNRRARWKTKQLERDFDVLKASYDSLLANYDSILKENDRLKSQVLRLTNQGQEEPPLEPEDKSPTPASRTRNLQPDMVNLAARTATAETASGHQHNAKPDSAGLSTGSNTGTTNITMPHEGVNNMHPVDSTGDSYFPASDEDYYPNPMPGHSEEDDTGTDGNGRNDAHLLQWFHGQGEYY